MKDKDNDSLRDSISALLGAQSPAMSDDEVLVATLLWMMLYGGKPRPLQSQLGAVLSKLFRERKTTLSGSLAQVIEGAASRGLVEAGGEAPKFWVKLTESQALESPEAWEAKLVASSSGHVVSVDVAAKKSSSSKKEPKLKKEKESQSPTKEKRAPQKKLSDTEAVQATLRKIAEEEDIWKACQTHPPARHHTPPKLF